MMGALADSRERSAGSAWPRTLDRALPPPNGKFENHVGARRHEGATFELERVVDRRRGGAT